MSCFDKSMIVFFYRLVVYLPRRYYTLTDESHARLVRRRREEIALWNNFTPDDLPPTVKLLCLGKTGPCTS